MAASSFTDTLLACEIGTFAAVAGAVSLDMLFLLQSTLSDVTIHSIGNEDDFGKKL
jgi:hypothetical protein